MIVYSGLYLLDRFSAVSDQSLLDFSKKTFLAAVLIISMIGLLSELVFGAWLGGVVIALICIFLSFVLVSRFILKLSWVNGIRMGCFSVSINILIWIIIYSL